ncbi:MAG: hypothetical protein ACLQDY_14370 [Streptosporangiaceae bacterium]
MANQEEIAGAGVPATAGDLAPTGDPDGHQAGAQASQEQEPRPVTYDDASRLYGPGTIRARERYDELSMRDHLARAYASLRASGEYDAARHGAGDTEPVTAAEHLELLATAEYLARAYKPAFEVDNALRAGASWAQVAEALGADEAMARVEYRAWADGQHDMLTWTEGRLGMSDAEYAEALARAGEPEPGAAKAYAATHRVLCVHADQDGQGAHWLAPGEKCAAAGDQAARGCSPRTRSPPMPPCWRRRKPPNRRPDHEQRAAGR